VLGEISLLTGEPCTASVEALTLVRSLCLDASDFHRLCQAHPLLAVTTAQLAGTRLGENRVDALCGKSVAGYRIQHRLGRGSMSVVYAAVDETCGRPVALKMMKPELSFDRDASQRFEQEARIGSLLVHPNIVRVFDRVAGYHTQFLVMERCSGPTLRELITAAESLDEPRIRKILGQLAAALLHAHGRKVVHRDLKPENVLFDDAGRVKLGDFGLARSPRPSGETQRGRILGTPRYMPPEQLAGDAVDHRIDVYAFGCVACELATRCTPFPGHNLAQLLEQKSKWSPQSISLVSPRVSSDLYELIARSLQPEPDCRTLDLRAIAKWGE
jgi:serine/threonine protein kinase